MSMPSDDAPMPPLRPNTNAPKTIGLLNVIFGVLLLLCGVCTGGYMAMMTAMGPMMAAQQQQAQATIKAQHQAEIKQLQDKEDATEDKEEKAALQAQRKRLEAQPIPQIPDTSRFLTAPLVRGYFIVDILTGILLNVLMIVSGAGLLGFKEWARVLALWVAGIKIVRLAAVYGFYMFAVVPIMAQEWHNMFDEMMKTVPTPPTPEEMERITTVMGVWMTGWAVGMIVLGAIYPLIVLILLTRPRVKAACAAPLTAYDDLTELGSAGPAAE